MGAPSGIRVQALDGMTMLLNETFDKLPKTPKHFPNCGDFKIEEEEEEVYVAAEVEMEETISMQRFYVIVGVMAAVILLLLLVIIGMHFSSKRSSPSKADKTGKTNQSFDESYDKYKYRDDRITIHMI